MTAETKEDDHGLVWGVSIETGLVLLVLYLMPKRLSRLEVYATWAVIAVFALAAHVAGTILFSFDDMMNPKMYWQGVIFEILFPSACGVIVANFMPPSRITCIPYAIVVAMLSDWILWLDVQLGFLKCHHWNLVWSGMVYFLGTIYLQWHLRFIRAQVGSDWKAPPG